MSHDGEIVLAELSAQEPIFHHPEFGSDRADFERLMMPDFCEVGASGRCYSRAYVLDELERRHAAGPQAEDWKAFDFRCRRLASEVYLLTYTLVQHGVRWTRRSTIWERTVEGWKIVYHQGTLVQEPDVPA